MKTVIESAKAAKDASASVALLDTGEQTLKDTQQTVEQDLQRFRDEENRLTPLLTESKVAWASRSSELAGREREEQQLRETLATLTQQSEQYRKLRPAKTIHHNDSLIESKGGQGSDLQPCAGLYASYCSHAMGRQTSNAPCVYGSGSDRCWRRHRTPTPAP
jgi:hypothetical protein